MARWISCLKQIVTTRLFGLGIAIIVLPLSAIKNQKPCKLSLKTEAKSVLKANKYSQITMQNGEMVNGKLKGYIEVGNEDDIIEILQTLFNGYGFSYITISNPSKNVPSGFSYSSGFVVHRWDTLSVILLSYSISKIAINSCIKKNNAYTWTGWKIFTGNS